MYTHGLERGNQIKPFKGVQILKVKMNKIYDLYMPKFPKEQNIANFLIWRLLGNNFGTISCAVLAAFFHEFGTY